MDNQQQYQPGQGQPAAYQNQVYSYAPGSYKRPFNTMAIVATIMLFVFTPSAIPFGHIALKQIKRTGERGRELALIVTVLGYVGLALVLIIFLALGLLLLFAPPSP